LFCQYTLQAGFLDSNVDALDPDLSKLQSQVLNLFDF